MDNLAITLNSLIPAGENVTVHEVSEPYNPKDKVPGYRYFELRTKIDKRMAFSAFSVSPLNTPSEISRKLKLAYRVLPDIKLGIKPNHPAD